jgi:hypothetical protein
MLSTDFVLAMLTALHRYNLMQRVPERTNSPSTPIAGAHGSAANRLVAAGRRAPALSMQCCGFDLQVAQEIGRTLHRHALMIEPQPIEAAQLSAIAGAAGPAVMTLRHDNAVPSVGVGD